MNVQPLLSTLSVGSVSQLTEKGGGEALRSYVSDMASFISGFSFHTGLESVHFAAGACPQQTAWAFQDVLRKTMVALFTDSLAEYPTPPSLMVAIISHAKMSGDSLDSFLPRYYWCICITMGMWSICYLSRAMEQTIWMEMCATASFPLLATFITKLVTAATTIQEEVSEHV